MPWEIQMFSQMVEQISKANIYINKEDEVVVHSCLNLSSYIIDWENSKLPKKFFIDHYNDSLSKLEELDVIGEIYDGNMLYGHLDFQRNVIQSDVDYYLSICPDTYFHPHSIFYIIESAKSITDRYFIITTETVRLWDETWDVMVNKNFLNIHYTAWREQNINKIIYTIENNNEEPHLEKINKFKYAGWFDLYNKNFYEKFAPSMEDWNGYGPWDTFSMITAGFARENYKTQINQYIIRNQIIFDINIKNKTNVYKKYIKTNNIDDQRNNFEKKMPQYFENWKEYGLKNNIF